MEKFEAYYKPGGTFETPTAEIISKYREKVPQQLIDIWEKYGFGKFNDGLIEFVNPDDFEDTMSTWLGRKVDNYTPFAITGFGELFYYRKLTETDEDVCMLDIQFRKIETLVWSFDGFVNGFLCEEEDRKEWLREDLFNDGIKEHGGLDKHEVFTITPALAIGGGLETKYLKKGNAQVYQDIIFQLTAG